VVFSVVAAVEGLDLHDCLLLLDVRGKDAVRIEGKRMWVFEELGFGFV
jgi:hypothetical protein